MKARTIFILTLLAFFELKCIKSPVKPEPGPPEIDLEQEASLVPWSKITGKIAYSRCLDSREWGGKLGEDIGYLFIIDGNSRKINLVKEEQGNYFYHLAWKPDGSKITYADRVAGSQLYNINPDGSNQERVFTFNVYVNNDCPAWSRDGILAYFSGWDDIYISGSPFFEGSCSWSRPAWSSESRFLAIAFGHWSTDHGIYKVSVSDKSYTTLIQESLTDSLSRAQEHRHGIFNDPIYSPDGSKIAFARFGKIWEIWIMNANRTNPTMLTSGWYPAWSPDGNRIAFVNDGKIFLMNSDGSDVTQVTYNEGYYPTWIE